MRVVNFSSMCHIFVISLGHRGHSLLRVENEHDMIDIEDEHDSSILVSSLRVTTAPTKRK